MAQHLGAAHVAAAKTFPRRALVGVLAAAELGGANVLAGMWHNGKPADVRWGFAEPVLRLHRHLAVHPAFECDDGEFEPRSEVVLKLLSFARVAGSRLHLQCATLYVEATELR